MRRSTVTACRNASPNSAVHAARRVPLQLLAAGIFVVCYFAQPFDVFYSADSKYSVDTYIAAIREVTRSRQVALVIMVAWATVEIMRHRSALRLNGVLSWLVLSFLFILIASVGWADDPTLSAKRVFVALAVVWTAVALAQNLVVEEMARLLFWVSLATVVVGCVAEMALGTIAPLDPAYRFAGTMHPNSAGAYCACLILAGVALGRSANSGSPYRLGAAIGSVFLLLTKSRTSVSACLLGLMIYLIATSARARYWVVIASTVAAFAAVPLLFVDRTDAERLLDVVLMGRPESASTVVTLTGRTELWQTLLQYVYERPLLGFGYGSFWTPQRLEVLTQREGWVFGSAHSEY